MSLAVHGILFQPFRIKVKTIWLQQNRFSEIWNPILISMNIHWSCLYWNCKLTNAWVTKIWAEWSNQKLNNLTLRLQRRIAAVHAQCIDWDNLSNISWILFVDQLHSSFGLRRVFSGDLTWTHLVEEKREMNQYIFQIL